MSAGHSKLIARLSFVTSIEKCASWLCGQAAAIDHLKACSQDEIAGDRRLPWLRGSGFGKRIVLLSAKKIS
jgi:hypothetical protein